MSLNSHMDIRVGSQQKENWENNKIDIVMVFKPVNSIPRNLFCFAIKIQLVANEYIHYNVIIYPC